MGKRNNYIGTIRQRKGLLIVVMAALLLELLSGAHYYYTRHLMEEELEKHVESELATKSLLIKSTLNASENIMSNHLWDIVQSLPHPDSVYSALTRMALFNHNLKGVGVGFVPYYYPSKGRLYELYAIWQDRKNQTVVTRQIADEAHHDYTQSLFWQQAMDSQGEAVWVDPYLDNEGAGGLVTTYAVAVKDPSDSLACVVGIDVSLEWLRDTIDGQPLYPSSFVLLLTEDGKPIIQPSENRIDPETTEHIISLINNSTVTRQPSRSGQSSLIHFNTGRRKGTLFYADLPGQPHWRVAMVFYDDEVFASLRQLRVHFLLLLLLVFGILLFVIARFARDEKKLHQKTLEQERISGELRVASNIQQALLPVDEPTLACTNEVCVEGRLIPAKDVGGDLYNAFVRDGKLFFCIGDVSGKGVPAALIMAVTQTLFRNVASHDSNPAHIMTLLNESACRNNKSNMFVTLFVGVLDLATGRLCYCNAGHETPIQTHPETRLLDAKPNLPVGLFDDFCYEMQETVMPPGATLLFYTDGLTEARNAKRELFGSARVLQMVSELSKTSPKPLVDAVIAQVQQFSDHTEQSDDIALLAIRYTPSEAPLVFDEELTLKNDLKEAARLSAFAKDVLARLKTDQSLSTKLRLALEEAVVNVMEYAYPSGTKGTVNIRAISNGSWLKYIITDTGVPFNPTTMDSPDTTLSVEERPVGGLGILLMRQIMDTIDYERIDGNNVLTLTKIITNK